jgi:hypothetical protein
VKVVTRESSGAASYTHTQNKRSDDLGGSCLLSGCLDWDKGCGSDQLSCVNGCVGECVGCGVAQTIAGGL